VNNEEFQVLIGSLLGDGCIIIPTGCKNAIYEEPKKSSDEEYLKWKAKILRRFGPRLCYANGYIKLYTRVHPELTELRKRWYPNGKRSIVPGDVEKLDALGLAVWYQDDGSYTPTSRVSDSVQRRMKYLREFFKKNGASSRVSAHVVQNTKCTSVVKDRKVF